MPDSNMSYSEFPNPRFSLIIPAYNEEAYLPPLLDTVDAARENYHCGADAIEVIVADNISTDATGHVARSRGCRVVREHRRLIAAVRNRGARAAKGQVLAFVDADTRIHPETFIAIDRVLSTGKVIAGATGVRMERMSLGIAISFLVVVSMVWLTGMDTGVVFCRREDFDAVGGYNEARLFAEDVQLLLDLKQLGRSRGQKLVRMRSAKAICSARKFDDLGEWHYLRMLGRLLYGLIFSRRSIDKYARAYWYGNQRIS